MTTRTVVALVAAVVLLGAVAPAVALPMMGNSAAPTDAAVQANNTTTGAAVQANNTTNERASLGASVSGFMQTSAASAEGEVDDGVFRASFANASDERKRALVTKRAAALEQRLERLRTRRAALLNGSDTPTVAERAKAARLTTEIDELKRAINTTDRAAAEVGVNVTRLERLRTEASELDGPEVAKLARGLAGHGNRGPPADQGPPVDHGPVVEHGPPTDHGSGNNANTTDTNATDDGSDAPPT